MPASDVEAVSHKKHKKSKKNKKEVEEEQVEEPQVAEEENGAEEQPAEEENGNGHVEEEAQEEEDSFQKKKKKKHSNDSENGGYQAVDDSKVSEVVKSLGDVAEELIEQFKSHAQKVIKKNKEDPAAPLAAAIAILSGATKKVTKSILTQRDVSFFFNFKIIKRLILIVLNFLGFYYILINKI